MNPRYQTLETAEAAWLADDADVPVDGWTLDELDDSADLGSVRSAFTSLDDFDD